MRIAIMQPTYLPWMGYFAMIDVVDAFVFLDSVQLVKRSWQTRNKIKNGEKELVLSLNLAKSSRDETMICDAKFSDEKWKIKHLNSINFAYKKAKYFDEVYPLLEEIFAFKSESLSKFNINLISKIAAFLGIKTKMLASSDLGGGYLWSKR